MYQTISETLEQQHSDFGAAEAHGVATGILSVEVRASAENWLREVLGNDFDENSEGATVLRSLFEQTRNTLDEGSNDFNFDLLLPDEDEPLADQAEALRTWCQGFLFGVGFTHSSAEWPNDIAEIIKDMVELSKIDSDIDDAEEHVVALTELHEYVRAAVFTVKDYFMDAGNGGSH